MTELRRGLRRGSIEKTKRNALSYLHHPHVPRRTRRTRPLRTLVDSVENLTRPSFLSEVGRVFLWNVCACLDSHLAPIGCANLEREAPFSPARSAFQQVFHPAAKCARKCMDGLGTRLVDVLIALLVHLNRPQADTGKAGELGLGAAVIRA